MLIPLDQPGSKARYAVDLYPEHAETGDGIVLAANREGLLALAETLRQLAESPEPDNHLHLGYSEQVPQGPGFRIVLNSTGRLNLAAT
ncbi:MAG: hypothetical protein M3R16_07605 [Pseudomonadota bacterium]|nr:hypothetical protein [Pseudomonadota bacterium]